MLLLCQAPRDKEAIAENLAESRKVLYNTPRGASVLRSCGVDMYLRSPAEWRQAAASAAAARDQFAQLFGSAQHRTGDGGSAGNGRTDEATAYDGSAEGVRGTKQQLHANGSAAGRKRTADFAAVDAAAEPKKKRKKAKVAALAAAVPLGGQQTEAMLDLLGTTALSALLVFELLTVAVSIATSICSSAQDSGKLPAATRSRQMSRRKRTRTRRQTSADPVL